MNIAVGLTCLVMMALYEDATGFSDNQLDSENQSQDNDGDLLERKDEDCKSKKACQIAGGQCQPKTEHCDGLLKKGSMYCKDNKNCGCCVRPGCVIRKKAYPNGSTFTNGCISLRCTNGVITTDSRACNFDCLTRNAKMSCAPSCKCRFVFGKGCILGEDTIPNHACRCKPDGPVTSQDTTCSGTVVQCKDFTSPFCENSGITWDYCDQGNGDCCGYAAAGC